MTLALVLPVFFFVGFGLNNSYVHQREPGTAPCRPSR